MARTITSANSIFTLVIPGLFPIPQTIQRYVAEGLFSSESVATVETVMGADGKLSAGWRPVEKKLSVKLMPDSPSSDLFDAWNAAQEAAREVYVSNGIIVASSIQRQFILFNGYLSGYVPVPEHASRILMRTFDITWEQIQVVIL